MVYPHAASIFALAALCTPSLAMPQVGTPRAPQRYTIHNIGTLSSDPALAVRAKTINNHGHVHGENDLPAPPGSGKTHGYVWNGHTMQHIYPLSPSVCWGGDMNDAGQCVGYSFAPANTLHAYLWDSGTTQDTHIGTQSFSKEEGINADGVGCGSFSAMIPGYMVSQFRPFISDHAGNWMDIGTFGGGTGFAYDINDHMSVVGSARDANEKPHPFIWNAASGMQNLGNLGGTFATPRSINNFDEVVGLSDNAAGDYRAFHWANGSMTDLATLGGTSAEAKGINDHGAIVGNSTDATGAQVACLWPDPSSPPINLQSALRHSSPWTLTGAKSINELGEICGTGYYRGNKRTYRLTPVVNHNRLSGAQPGIAGQDNTLFGLGFTPNAMVEIAYGFARGRTASSTCPGASYGIANAQVLTTTQADSDGRITVTVSIPKSWIGAVVFTQALDMSPCVTGEVCEQILR